MPRTLLPAEGTAHVAARTTRPGGTLVLASLALAVRAAPAAARGQDPATGTQEAERKEGTAALATVPGLGGRGPDGRRRRRRAGDCGQLGRGAAHGDAPAERFAAAVSANAAVMGAGRVPGHRPVPNGPQEPLGGHREGDRRACRGHGRRRGRGISGAEPLADLQWDMRRTTKKATPQGSYKVNPGRKGVLVGRHPHRGRWQPSRHRPRLQRRVEPQLHHRHRGHQRPADDPEWPPRGRRPTSTRSRHGTHVAGTIGSPLNGLGIGGVAPNVTLVNLRAGQDSGFFFLAATVDALTYAGPTGSTSTRLTSIRGSSTAWPTPPTQPPSRPSSGHHRGHPAGRALRPPARLPVAALRLQHHASMPTRTSLMIRLGTRTREIHKIVRSSTTRLSVGVAAPRLERRKVDVSVTGCKQTDFALPGGYFRDLSGTPQHLGAGEPHPRSVPVRRRHDRGLRGHQHRATARSVRHRRRQGRHRRPAPTGSTCRARRWRARCRPVPAPVVSAHGRRDSAHGGLTLDPGVVEKVMRQTAIDTPCPNPPLVDYIDEGRDPPSPHCARARPGRTGSTATAS